MNCSTANKVTSKGRKDDKKYFHYDVSKEKHTRDACVVFGSLSHEEKSNKDKIKKLLIDIKRNEINYNNGKSP